MTNKNKIKPTLGSGFRDLSGDFLATKKKIIQIIEDNYLRYGYTEISQPSLEISSQVRKSTIPSDAVPSRPIPSHPKDFAAFLLTPKSPCFMKEALLVIFF